MHHVSGLVEEEGEPLDSSLVVCLRHFTLLRLTNFGSKQLSAVAAGNEGCVVDLAVADKTPPKC